MWAKSTSKKSKASKSKPDRLRILYRPQPKADCVVMNIGGYWYASTDEPATSGKQQYHYVNGEMVPAIKQKQLDPATYDGTF